VTEQGQRQRDDVLKLVESAGICWTRIAAIREGGDWHGWLLEVVSGAQPLRWIELRWEYDDALFVSSVASADVVCDWLRNECAVVGDFSIKFGTIHEQVQWNRKSSRQGTGYEVLEWPTVDYQFYWERVKQGAPNTGALIGRNAPSFVGFAQGAASFLGIALGAGGSVDHMSPTFRMQDLSGRIVKVVLGAASISVYVEGTGLDSMTVELAGDAPGPSAALPSGPSATVEFPLPGGLPSGSWVVLKSDSEWVDRKFINFPHTMTPDPGVETLVEPSTELQTLVAQGEDGAVEFKSVIPEPKSALREKVCRTVAAFANGMGGHVLFGVEDDGTMVGLDANPDIRQASDTITRFVTSTVTPLPSFRVNPITIDVGTDRVVLVLTVDQGESPPYGINPANPQYYVRRGATTFPASADQVRALARSRPPADQANGWGLRSLFR
jgi:Putative DNA-binding domain